MSANSLNSRGLVGSGGWNAIQHNIIISSINYMENYFWRISFGSTVITCSKQHWCLNNASEKRPTFKTLRIMIVQCTPQGLIRWTHAYSMIHHESVQSICGVGRFNSCSASIALSSQLRWIICSRGPFHYDFSACQITGQASSLIYAVINMSANSIVYYEKYIVVDC